MEFEHSPECLHCLNGCRHPHDESDPLAVRMEMGACIPGVRGSRMRHGGTFTDPATGLTIASDQWVRSRCGFCGDEAMTPEELMPPWATKAADGAFLHVCGSCLHDQESGFEPGHNPHRRRRRARH